MTFVEIGNSSKLHLAYEWPMIEIKKFIPGNPRTRLAALLIALSLVAAVAISSTANRANWQWSASHDISPGHLMTGADIKKVKANLFESGSKYFSTGTALVGWRATRTIRGGELIPVAALSRKSSAFITQSLPLRVGRSDMPIDLTSGELVDLYALAPNTAQATFDPFLAFSNATVESIDQKSKDLGGDIGIVVAIPKSSMAQVVRDIATAKVLVVRNGF